MPASPPPLPKFHPPPRPIEFRDLPQTPGWNILRPKDDDTLPPSQQSSKEEKRHVRPETTVNCW